MLKSVVVRECVKQEKKSKKVFKCKLSSRKVKIMLKSKFGRVCVVVSVLKSKKDFALKSKN